MKLQALAFSLIFDDFMELVNSGKVEFKSGTTIYGESGKQDEAGILSTSGK